MYTNKKNLYDETKSTAWSFTLISVLGFGLIGLLWFDVLPFRLASHMKIIFSVVMGIVFAIFLIIGIRSFLSLGRIGQEAASQEERQTDVRTYFMEHFREKILAFEPEETDIQSADLYFLRIEQMRKWLTDAYPSLSEEEAENLLEELYNEIFPE